MKIFECITTDNPESAYENYLSSHTALHFSRKGIFIPNIEFKFPKTDLDMWALNSPRKVLLNENTIKISPIELQIPYKLFLGTDKDIEDAKHLYKLLKGTLNHDLLKYFLEKLDKGSLFNKYLV